MTTLFGADIVALGVFTHIFLPVMRIAMRTPIVLLRFFGKALLNAAGLGVVGDVADFILDVLPEVVKDVWDWWGPDREPALKLAELEALADAPPDEILQAAV